MTSVSTVAELSHAAGYARVTPLVAGISMRSGGPLFFAQGAGLDGAAFGAESVAYAASLAKQITGACAALLEHEGALDPEARIAEWVPELPPWSERVRVRHLIHHTAGLPDVWPQMQDGGESDWTSRGVLAALAATPQLDREPGTVYAYSSVGYVCLASIIERISGSTLDRFAQSRLFEPLGMKSSCFWTGPSAPPTAAVVPEPRKPAPLSVGDGGLWTSVSDLLHWNGALLDDALGVTATMHTPGCLDDGTRSTTPGECACSERQVRTCIAMAVATGLRQRSSSVFRIVPRASQCWHLTAASNEWCASETRCNRA
jgi:CubicO group peptidase (beta-lactamase class C family)